MDDPGWLHELDAIEGNLLHEEGLYLHTLAALQLRAYGGQVVELGTRYGRSAAYLATAVRDYGQAPLVCVDAWGFPEGPMRFVQNMERHGLLGHIVPLHMTTKDAIGCLSRHLTGEVSLVFCDADHEYDAVARDFGLYGPLLQPGGVFVFHDYNLGFPGVTRFVDEAVRPLPEWRCLGTVGSIIAFRRLEGRERAA